MSQNPPLFILWVLSHIPLITHSPDDIYYLHEGLSIQMAHLFPSTIPSVYNAGLARTAISLSSGPPAWQLARMDGGLGLGWRNLWAIQLDIIIHLKTDKNCLKNDKKDYKNYIQHLVFGVKYFYKSRRYLNSKALRWPKTEQYKAKVLKAEAQGNAKDPCFDFKKAINAWLGASKGWAGQSVQNRVDRLMVDLSHMLCGSPPLHSGNRWLMLQTDNWQQFFHHNPPMLATMNT